MTYCNTVTLISLKEVSASTVKVVSPLPLREDDPPKDVRIPPVKAEAARDPCEFKQRTFHLSVILLRDKV